ncbi:hypothetical protein EJ03DRAFT_346850 [Teratosphaeria nubilosa]|uniref:Uncharacterized protein n=1 Tax=Teratosphaeria nubilosa TaxID=161662 RepID=A0A6G1LMM4_9PEZI|nr:hypothetical protein EJ03DRAFT_346850 [Teratosphaeria nubilosa]
MSHSKVAVVHSLYQRSCAHCFPSAIVHWHFLSFPRQKRNESTSFSITAGWEALAAAPDLGQALLLSSGLLADALLPLARATSYEDPAHPKARSASASATLASNTKTPNAALFSSPFLLTLRIVRLVNTFRKRAKTGLSSRPRHFTKRQDFRQEVERAAYEEIDRYLGRKTGRQYCRESAPTQLVSKEDVGRGSLDRLIEQINTSVSFHGSNLTVIAKDHHLFLDRKADLRITRLPLHELVGLAVTVKDLLVSLKRISTRRGFAKSVCEGNEVLDITLDDIGLANLEHLLLCLQHQLIHLLLSQCADLIRRHILDCQKDQSKHGEDWFFTFPNARHPLSTTWPWSIKPSLAVIWGACWMFYDLNSLNYYLDSRGNMVDVVTGRVVAPAWAVREAQMNAQREQRPQTLYAPAAAHLALGPTGSVSNSPAAQPSATASSGVANWLPQENFDLGSISASILDSTYGAGPGWRQPQQQFGHFIHVELALPLAAQHPRHPSIITSDLSA